MWQSSVWGQSSVWDESSDDPDGVSAYRIMQSSVWQSSVWKDHVHSGRVWRMQAAAKFPKDTVRAGDATDFTQNGDIDVAGGYVTMPMSWKTATLDGLKQVCPPWHLYQITEMSPGLMTGPGTASGEVDKTNTCFPDSMQMPEEVRTGVNGLGEDVHIFILDTGVDAYHPDLIGVADPDDAHHYNAVAKEDEDGCDVDLRCMLKYGDKVLVDGVETMVAEEHCSSPTVDWYVTRSHPASDSRAHFLRTSHPRCPLPCDTRIPPENSHGHGTHAAGLAVGAVSGVAKRATLHSVRVANCKGSAETDDIVRGLKFVQGASKDQRWPLSAGRLGRRPD